LLSTVVRNTKIAYNTTNKQSNKQSNTMETDEPIMGVAMTERAQQVRRNSIRDILGDDDLTPLEKRKSIQSLMDGRRRSSNGTRSSSGSTGEMERAAAEAAEFYSSDTDDDCAMEGISGTEQQQYYQQQQQQQYQQQQQQQQQQQHEQQQQHPSENQDGGAGDGAAPNKVDWNTPHGRKQRSASLPGWSEGGMNAVAPLAAASSNNVWDEPINVNRRMEKSRPACNHYERNCTIISPCCGLAFGCRICHDECPVLPMPFSKRQINAAMEANGGQQQHPSRVNWQDNVEGVKQKQEKRRSLPLGFDEEETHHEIDRFAMKEIICRLCYVRQSSKT
jgi:hypothetical protein